MYWEPSEDRQVNKKVRRYERASLECPATVKGRFSWVMSRCRDICEGGAYVADLGVEPVGSVVDVELELPGRDAPVLARARIAWREGEEPGSGGGVEFLRLQTADRKWLVEFVKKHGKTG